MTVAWELPGTRTRDAVGPELPVVAVIVGASVPGLVASVGWWLQLDYLAAVAGIGMLMGPVLAVLAGGRITGERWPWWSVVLGVAAPLVAGGAVVAFLALGAIGAAGTDPASLPGLVAGGIALILLVAVVALVAGAPITLPIAIVTGFLVHRAATMPPGRASWHIAVLAAAMLLVGLPTGLSVASEHGLLAEVGVPSWLARTPCCP